MANPSRLRRATWLRRPRRASASTRRIRAPPRTAWMSAKGADADPSATPPAARSATSRTRIIVHSPTARRFSTARRTSSATRSECRHSRGVHEAVPEGHETMRVVRDLHGTTRRRPNAGGLVIGGGFRECAASRRVLAYGLGCARVEHARHDPVDDRSSGWKKVATRLPN